MGGVFESDTQTGNKWQPMSFFCAQFMLGICARKGLVEYGLHVVWCWCTCGLAVLLGHGLGVHVALLRCTSGMIINACLSVLMYMLYGVGVHLAWLYYSVLVYTWYVAGVHLVLCRRTVGLVLKSQLVCLPISWSVLHISVWCSLHGWSV